MFLYYKRIEYFDRYCNYMSGEYRSCYLYFLDIVSFVFVGDINFLDLVCFDVKKYFYGYNDILSWLVFYIREVDFFFGNFEFFFVFEKVFFVKNNGVKLIFLNVEK